MHLIDLAAFWRVHAAMRHCVDFPNPWSVTPEMIEYVPVSGDGAIGAKHFRKTDLPWTIGTEKLLGTVSFRVEGFTPALRIKQGNVSSTHEEKQKTSSPDQHPARESRRRHAECLVWDCDRNKRRFREERIEKKVVDPKKRSDPLDVSPHQL